MINPQSIASVADCRRRIEFFKADQEPGDKSRLNLVLTSSLRLFVSPSLRRLQLHTIPPEDPAVYDMICDADTIGVFQIESRRRCRCCRDLRPRNFYDLVIEVAIVRPGPIQGNMVHPYLAAAKRRRGSHVIQAKRCEACLQKTLGVPLFQEQAMKRRDGGARVQRGGGRQAPPGDGGVEEAAARSKDSIRKSSMACFSNGYTREFAEQCFSRSRVSANTDFPNRTRRRSRCWCTSARG